MGASAINTAMPAVRHPSQYFLFISVFVFNPLRKMMVSLQFTDLLWPSFSSICYECIPLAPVIKCTKMYISTMFICLCVSSGCSRTVSVWTELEWLSPLGVLKGERRRNCCFSNNSPQMPPWPADGGGGQTSRPHASALVPD